MESVAPAVICLACIPFPVRTVVCVILDMEPLECIGRSNPLSFASRGHSLLVNGCLVHGQCEMTHEGYCSGWQSFHTPQTRCGKRKPCSVLFAQDAVYARHLTAYSVYVTQKNYWGEGVETLLCTPYSVPFILGSFPYTL